MTRWMGRVLNRITDEDGGWMECEVMKEEAEKPSEGKYLKGQQKALVALKITKSHIQQRKRGLTRCDGSAFFFAH